MVAPGGWLPIGTAMALHIKAEPEGWLAHSLAEPDQVPRTLPLVATAHTTEMARLVPFGAATWKPNSES